MNQNPLNDLRDIHFPSAPSMWPPAIGWWIVILIPLILFALFIVYLVLNKKKRLIKREMLKEIAIYEIEYKNSHNHAMVMAQMSALLKRLAAEIKNQPELKAKELGDLKDILSKSFRSPKKTMKLQNLLIDERFKPQAKDNAEEILALSKELIKRCRL